MLVSVVEKQSMDCRLPSSDLGHLLPSWGPSSEHGVASLLQCSDHLPRAGCAYMRLGKTRSADWPAARQSLTWARS
ncbi:hypothetical protein Mapa_003048 [Marchantia paleacea]|nr:hypothetical protein Mapa_003048 [Marchantia paleacea]